MKKDQGLMVVSQEVSVLQCNMCGALLIARAVQALSLQGPKQLYTTSILAFWSQSASNSGGC